MDIARPSQVRAKRIRMGIYAGVGLVFLAGTTYALSRLKPAAPEVDKGVLWTGLPVARGPMVVDRRGLGTLVPVDIRWIAAQSNARVQKILLRSGATVEPSSIIVELDDPQLKSDTTNAEFAYKAAQADLVSVKVGLDNSLMQLRSQVANTESAYQQAKMQAAADKLLFDQGLGPQINAEKSRVASDQLGIQEKLGQDQIKIAADNAQAQIASSQAKVDQARQLYQLDKDKTEALHVRAGLNGVLQCVCTVIGTDLQEGQSVTIGTNLARVADPTRLKATIQIAETQAKDILLGQKASIDTRNGIVPGHVTRVDGAVVNGTRGVDVTLDGELPPGAVPDLSVDGDIIVQSLKDVLYVGRPVHGDADSTVGLFKLNKPTLAEADEATRVQVKFGIAAVNTMQVLSGLNVGDMVILSDMSQWENVDRVRLK